MPNQRVSQAGIVIVLMVVYMHTGTGTFDGTVLQFYTSFFSYSPHSKNFTPTSHVRGERSRRRDVSG
jgi:hypothetical protein